MKKFFALALAGVLLVSPFAMAGELSSADSDFLFSAEQGASTTISAEEMTTTAGQDISISISAPGVVRTVTPSGGVHTQADVELSVPAN